jgi:hypothetical protein
VSFVGVAATAAFSMVNRSAFNNTNGGAKPARRHGSSNRYDNIYRYDT